MNYGLPYKGSKNKLAERIVDLLPKRTHLIDLFCGGCAVSHAALLKRKFQHIHINDLNWMCPTLFIDALNGKYENDTRWISREDFFRLRDTDPFVAIVWSFGNNMCSYLYSVEIEPLKRAIHYAVFFDDYEPGLALGYDFSFTKSFVTHQQKYAAIRRFFVASKESDSTLLPKSSHSLWDTNTFKFNLQKPISDCAELRVWEMENIERRNRFCQFQKKRPAECKTRKDCIDVCRLEYRERIHRILPIWGCSLSNSIMDYAKVEIPKDSVIYCDIPYKGTDKYVGANNFDYERFYDWASNQTEPVFISSYEMPSDRFDCVAEWNHRSILNKDSNIAVKERLFVPHHQTERGNIEQQLPLFEGMNW